ncbi:AraC family transcriptional regulator [Caulobacter sp. BK020]|uniref:helix-turn-helix domain-containing protein n=1 Tax=Caulobacter sp. BK020 TaxID=2512117 RepID=UPI00104CE981|nr:AraC family transcriptional regulator [Caulobacter sp. BK020]TCS11937.1 AraC-like DNA-binding protein [Caulobacter sp. BK020]
MGSAATLGSSIAAVRRGLGPWRSWSRLQVHAAIATASFVCYILGRLLDGRAALFFSVIGVGACGWAWLAARALFDPAEQDARWPRVVALTVAVSGALSAATPASALVGRVAENVYALSGSAALLLTFVEPFQRYARDLAVGEKRFRALFVATYALLVAVAVLGLRAVGEAPEEAVRDDLVKSACAFAGLGALVGAVWFRRRHPLTRAATTSRRVPTADDWRLAERLRGLLAKEAIERQTDLKIGDVAARLGEPEYRVSQCISAALGFANFNRWINHHRIARAKDLLAQADEQRSILEIAFVCGFSSLGPFNRAFRDEVGMTPRVYRTTMRGTKIQT